MNQQLEKIVSIPNRCIWCLKKAPEVQFDISHVVPKCVGNDKQMLPKGIVCQKCNNYFSHDVEPTLLDDPLFHVIAVILQLKHPDQMSEFRNRIFDNKHPSETRVEKEVHLNGQLNNSKYSLEISYKIKGRLIKEYKPRELSFLSRAIHKIAYESLAWCIFVKGLDHEINIFDSRFDYIRQWARLGQPQNSIRPIIRRQYFSPQIRSEWVVKLWNYPKWMGLEIDLFGDWYGVCLTSASNEANNYFREVVEPSDDTNITWLLDSKFTKLDK